MMELVQLVIYFVISMALLITVYNSMGTEKKPEKKDYSNERLSKAFAHGCAKALWGNPKKK